MKRNLIYFVFFLFCTIGCNYFKSDYDKIPEPKTSIDNTQYLFLKNELNNGKHLAVYYFKNKISYALLDSTSTQVVYLDGVAISHEDFLKMKSTKEEITSLYYMNADVLNALENIMSEGRRLVIHYENNNLENIKNKRPNLDVFDENGKEIPGGGDGLATPVGIPAPPKSK
jgi:hypothetical protein